MRRENYDYYDEEIEEDVLDIEDLIFTLLRRWKLIILTMIPVLVLGFIFANTRPTLYQAETSLMISGNNVGVSLDRGDIDLNQKLTVTYLELAKSKVILQNVIRKFDLKEDEKTLASNISILPVADTEIIKLSYKNSDPQLAAVITNEIAKQFITRVSNIMKVRNISVIDVAEIPTKPLPKKRVLIILASGMAGLVLGVGVAFIVEFMFAKLRKPKDIERILGVPMIGMIPEFQDIKNEMEIEEEEIEEKGEKNA